MTLHSWSFTVMYQSFLQTSSIPRWTLSQPRKGHTRFSSEKENSAALMRTDQTASSLQACLYLNWPSAGRQGVPSRISVGWISDPFCPYQETGRMSFGSTHKQRNSRPDSQTVSELSERQHPWNRCALFLYFYNGNWLLSQWHTHCLSSCLYSIPHTGHSNCMGGCDPYCKRRTSVPKGYLCACHISNTICLTTTFFAKFHVEIPRYTVKVPLK